MMVKPPVLLTAVFMMGTTALAAPTVAVNPEHLSPNAETTTLVNAPESGELIAGRDPFVLIFGRGSRRDFDRYYLRHCNFRLTLEECYRRYRRKRRDHHSDFRRRRDFDRYDDWYDDEKYEHRGRRHRGHKRWHGDDDDDDDD